MSVKKSKTGRRRPIDAETGKEGLIIAHHGVAVEVLFEDGQRSQVRVKRRSGHVVGDNVTVTGEVLKRHVRKTELRRRDARGAVHLVGANLDVLGIVISPRPLPPTGFIDRAIVSARSANLKPFLVINKCDLENSAELIEEVKNTYGHTIPIFHLSAARGEGLDSLRTFFAEGHRGAFVGTTGVGKSSLLNALVPGINLNVGEICEQSGLGRHTTTVSTLHSLPGGGELVDTPGFRDFGLVDISVDELAVHFPGFEKTHEVTCRFRDCRHRSEPGCAVHELVEENEVPQERYDTYMEILEEIEVAEEEARRRGWKN